MSDDVITVGLRDVVTRIEVFPSAKGALLAFVKVHVADYFVINCYLRQGRRGPYLSFPGHRNRKGEWEDDVTLTSGEIRETLTAMVLAAYQEKAAGVVRPRASSSRSSDPLPF